MEADDTTERAALDALLLDLDSDGSFVGTLYSPRVSASVCSMFGASEDPPDDVFAALEQHFQQTKSVTSMLQNDIVDVQTEVLRFSEKAGTGSVGSKCGGGNLARKRQREEIHALRKAAMRLESQLEFLKRKDGSADVESHDTSRGACAERSGLASDDEQVRSTVFENIYLKKLRSDHTKVINKFAKAMRDLKPLTLSEIMDTSATLPFVQTSVPSYPRSTPDAMIFKRLARNVEMHYHQLDQVFQKVGLTEAIVDIEDAQLDTSHDGGGAVLKFTSSRVIPFQLHQVNDAAMRLRNTGSLVNLKGRGQMYEYSATSVAIEIQFVVGDVVVTLRGISKRFYEHGRTVFVWDGVSEWPIKSTGQVVTIEERSWGIVKPLRRKGSRSFPASLLRSYVCLTPGASKQEMARRDKHLSLLSEIVLPTYQQHFASHMQLLENALLEQSL
ncbi:hypothetical protein FI667_g11884, partial [Globisporangium splendens]